MRPVRRVWDLGFVKDFGGCAGADAAKTHVPAARAEERWAGRFTCLWEGTSPKAFCPGRQEGNHERGSFGLEGRGGARA